MARTLNDKLRSKLYNIIHTSDTTAGRTFDVVLLWLIILSILSVFLESVASIREKNIDVIRIAEWFFTICFTLEYIIRLYSSKKPLNYIFSFYGLVDLLAFLPTYMSLFLAGTQYLVVIRALRLLRVFRILKLRRFLAEGAVLTTALRASRYKITVFLMSVLTLIIIVGTLMYLVEGEERGFTSIPASIYWAIVTITTVGYGDMAPQTALGQFIASFLMIVGYGIIAVPTGIVSVEMARASDDARTKCNSCRKPLSPPNANFCFNCGEKVVKEA
jgi:voltage-gated potassium channel